MATKKADPKLKEKSNKALATLKKTEKEITIASHDDYQFATTELFKIKEQLKEWEERNATFTKPAKEILTAAKDTFGGVISYLKEREVTVKNTVSEYLIACETRRVQTLRKAQQVAKVNRVKGQEMIHLAAQETPPKINGIGTRPNTVIEVFDESLVPEEFFKTVRVLDRAKLEKHVLETGEDVNGVLVKAVVGIVVTVGQRTDA